jgi:predicted phage terminase large subunit-like protein
MIIKVPKNTLDVVITCDPAISEKESACRTAITCVAMSPYSKIFLLDYWAGRQRDPDKVIQTMLNMAAEYLPRAIGIETVGYQQALMPFMQRAMTIRGQYWPVIEMKPDRKEKKEARILSLQPYFRAGQIFIPRGAAEFIEEYETFPFGKTCDILDAFSYALRLLVPMQGNKKPALEDKLEKLALVDQSSARYWRRDAERRGILEPLEDPDIEDIEFEPAVSGVGDFIR